MPIADPIKLQLAQKRLLMVKICRKCGARNASTAERCRKCRSYDLRWKKRTVQK